MAPRDRDYRRALAQLKLDLLLREERRARERELRADPQSEVYWRAVWA